MEKTTGEETTVKVQKDITLATGESLTAYTQKVRDAGCKYVKQKLNLPAKDAYCYPVEVFSKSVVFGVSMYGPNIEEAQRYRHFAASYTRKDTGVFEFDTLTEVEQVVSYQPKATASVTKAKETAAAFEMVTLKSIWSGVL